MSKRKQRRKRNKRRKKRQARKQQRKSNRYRISDALWEKFKPLIPERKNPHPRGGGRKPNPDRQVMNAIFFVLRTGCQWKALDETRICSGSVAHARFQKWVQAGVFLKFWQAGLTEYDEFKGIDWKWQSMDGAMTKAPLGGEKNGAESHRPGQERCETQLAY
jgi:transposase